MRVLGPRALNRALLARQFLLRRVHASPLDVVHHLCGMQAQAPFPPYFGLWSRLHGFTPRALADLLLDRSVVRIVLMRGTVHLVTADDCLFLRPLVQQILDNDLRTNTQYAAALRNVDFPSLATKTRALLTERPHTAGELGKALAEAGGHGHPAALAHAARGLVPLVQVPPRAVWGRSGEPTYATAEDWLGRPLRDNASRADLVVRYLSAFGPATVRDVQAWSGLTRLGEVLDRLRPRLEVFADEQGRELFDVPEAPRPEPDTPAPPRFIAEFDNLLLAHADRTRVLTDEHRKRLFSARNGLIPGTILVDGFVRGTWRIRREQAAATLEIEPYQRISTKDAGALESAGRRLLKFAAPGATHAVTFAGDRQPVG